ncbi:MULTISPECIES: TIGR00266 family protein [Clostridiaceae]|uniref:TIGR00266 family protein n=1 Tax=Clostridium facile TaxID=2763035 RepID=A0ABR7IMZ5_9CLOT|nr:MULTISPECIES: TIGR00266 family protein [Clostridiaceae]MBC5786510.1 TIGR00266 family protein [Clostridium facile]PWN00266.1 MAG: TIGR00266 family protein [Massilioclostridium sp.]
MQYKIEGTPMPVVVCTLENGETMITESGAMSWMTPNMKMETTSGGGVGKVFSRMMSGESLFLNRYTAQNGQGMIAFASSFPGSMRAINISANQGMIVQKSAFLAAESGVQLSIAFQKKIGGGFFGGEGFIMQRLSGQGTAFIEIDGYAMEYLLQPGQSMIVDTGYLAAMSETCTIDVQKVPGVKNMLFGGEGIFNTVVTGPGTIILQTMPINQMAAVLRPFFPSNS